MNPVRSGQVSPEVEAEFPGASLRWCIFPSGEQKTPSGLEQELDVAADRIAGAQAVRIATDPTVAQCRAWRAQLGMDPASGNGTAEAVVRRRLLEGGFRPSGLVSDAIALATLETGIPIWTFGVAAHDEDPLIELCSDAQTQVLELRLNGQRMSVLFGDTEPRFLLTTKSELTCLVALGSPGVQPAVVDLALERALGLCSEA